MDRYIVMTSAAKMPNKVRAPYGNVAVVETDGEHMPKQIHAGHKSVVSIPWFRGRLHMGYNTRSTRTAFALALIEAKRVAAELNARATEGRDHG